jgi:hypothetical protein
MLFPLAHNSPRSKIFIALNTEFLNFLENCIAGTTFQRSLFTAGGVGDACWDNDDTKRKFQSLWICIRALRPMDRTNLHNQISQHQNVTQYFINKASNVPVITPAIINKRIYELTKHLFTATKKLRPIIRACENECIHSHFELYRNINGNLCQFCGTKPLEQPREGVLFNDQWLADYDHLLGKAKYPIFAVHADNLLPTCDTCNRKSKSTKELITLKRKNQPDRRRLFFNVYQESCEALVTIKIEDTDGTLRLAMAWDEPDVVTKEKLETWNDVYQIRTRVERKLGPFTRRLAIKLKPRNYADFSSQISRHAQTSPIDIYRDEEWFFWEYKLYSWLNQQTEQFKLNIWSMLDFSQNDRRYGALYNRY